MTLTPEQIDQMDAGGKLDSLIEIEIYDSTPLTDGEIEIFKAASQMFSPSSLPEQISLFKIHLSEPDWQTKLMFRLSWPRSHSSDGFGDASRQLVSKMRDEGWLFESYDASDGFRIVRFIHKESKGKYKGDGMAKTDALAICRAALQAKLALNKRGEK
jgi:hypothetical protein